MHRVNFGHNGTLSLPLKCPTCVTIKNVRDLNVRLIWLDLNRGAMLINHGHLIHETWQYAVSISNVEARLPIHLQPDQTETGSCSSLPQELWVSCQHKTAHQSWRHPTCNAQFTSEPRVQKQLLSQAQMIAKRTQLGFRELDHHRQHKSLHMWCIASAAATTNLSNLVQGRIITVIPPRAVRGERFCEKHRLIVRRPGERFGDTHHLIVRHPRNGQRSLHNILLLVQRYGWQCFVKKSGRVFWLPSQSTKRKIPWNGLLGLFVRPCWDWAWCLLWYGPFYQDFGQRLHCLVTSVQTLANWTLLWSQQTRCPLLQALHHRSPIPAPTVLISTNTLFSLTHLWVKLTQVNLPNSPTGGNIDNNLATNFALFTHHVGKGGWTLVVGGWKQKLISTRESGFSSHGLHFVWKHPK